MEENRNAHCFPCLSFASLPETNLQAAQLLRWQPLQRTYWLGLELQKQCPLCREQGHRNWRGGGGADGGGGALQPFLWCMECHHSPQCWTDADHCCSRDSYKINSVQIRAVNSSTSCTFGETEWKLSWEKMHSFFVNKKFNEVYPKSLEFSTSVRFMWWGKMMPLLVGTTLRSELFLILYTTQSLLDSFLG